MREQLKEFVLESLDSNVEAKQGILNSTVNKLTIRGDALEATVTAIKEQIVELKGELTIYKAPLCNGMLALVLMH